MLPFLLWTRNIRPEIHPIRKPSVATALLACTFFYLTGRAFVPWLGLQNDEALFGAALYDTSGLAMWRWVFGHKVPLMMMSYLGTLKTLLYAPVFEIWPPASNSIRLPMVLAGTATVWLFFALLRRVSSVRAAVLGCLLLATDATYLLTTCFDWGPVALQHLLLVGGGLLLVIFCQSRRLLPLAGGCLLFGLALWDKALFVWMLGGFSVAAVVVYPRQILHLVTFPRAIIALAAFCAGALPFLLFNLNPQHRWETFRSNASWTAGDLPGKARMARFGLEGNALFGWLVRENEEVATPQPARTVCQRASFWLNGAAGGPRRSLQGWAFVAALLLLPWLAFRQGWQGEVRVLVFALVFLGVAWTQMALTRGAGGSAHHVVLLWPAPQLFIAVALAAASRDVPRGALAAAALGCLLAVSNLLVVNHYYVLTVRNGGSLNWTDAVYPMARFVRQVPARQMFITDWGILDSLRLLDGPGLPLRVGTEAIGKPVLEAADVASLHQQVSDPSNIFIGHTEGNEFFTGARQKLLDNARSFGLRREMLTVVADRHGRPMFEVFRFVR